MICFCLWKNFCSHCILSKDFQIIACSCNSDHSALKDSDWTELSTLQHSLIGVSLSARNVLKLFGFFFHCFKSSVSLSHVSEKPYIVFVPRSFIISCRVNLFQTRLCTLTWKIFKYLFMFRNNFVKALKLS